MQQRRVRLGDILDDYCPRERRITNHAVVAMIDDSIKQTRCTTCDAEHEYREGKVPASRRRKAAPPAAGVLTPAADAPRTVLESPEPEEVEADSQVDAVPQERADEPPETDDAEGSDDREQEEWPVHRRLIRATLPRPEGQIPERKAPEFTFRSGGRFDGHRNGQRKGANRPARQAHGQPSGQGRFSGSRPGSGQGPRQGGGQGQPRSGNRGAPGGGGHPQGRGPRPGGGRKRGR